MEIREGTRKLHLRPIGEWVHIDRTHQVPMPGKLASMARPMSALGLVFVPTSRTAARGASFGAGEAHEVGSFGLVAEVVDVHAIFPRGHPLIVLASTVLAPDPMRIPDEQGANFMFNAEVDHGPGRFVSSITNTVLCTTALLILGALQLLPAPRILLAPSLLLGELTQLLASLAFERPNPAPGHDQSLAGVGGHGGQMNLAQIYRRLHGARSLGGLGDLDDHMQLKAIVPD